MAKAAAEESAALGPNGEPVVTEETKKTIRRKATPQEVGSNGTGKAETDDAEDSGCGLFPNAGQKAGDPNYITQVRVYAGTSIEGSHIDTITDKEALTSLSPDYFRDNYQAEYGNLFYAQGCNAKGRPVPGASQKVKLATGKSAGGNGNGNGHGSDSQILALMQSQLSQQQTLLLALIAKDKGAGGDPVLTAAITALGNIAANKKDEPTNPVLTAMMEQMRADRAAAEQRASDERRRSDSLLEKLSTGGSNPINQAAMGMIGTAMTAAQSAISMAVDLRSGNQDPKLEWTKFITGEIKGAIREDIPAAVAGIVGAVKSPGAPPPNPAQQAALPPADPNANGTVRKRILRVVKPGESSPTGSPPPQPSSPSPTAGSEGQPAAAANESATPAQPTPQQIAEAFKQMTEEQAVTVADQLMRDPSKPTNEPASVLWNYFLMHDQMWIVKLIADASDDQVRAFLGRLRTQDGRDARPWADEPALKPRYAEVLAHIRAWYVAHEQRKAANASAK